MKIRRIPPPSPPPSFVMEFSRNDGWAILAALQTYIEKHPHAAHTKEWKKWASELDRNLRQ